MWLYPERALSRPGRWLALPYFDQSFDERPRSERDAATIENQRVLIRQLEARLKRAHDRIADLEFLVGADKRNLLDENNQLKADLRRLNRELCEALGIPFVG